MYRFRLEADGELHRYCLVQYSFKGGNEHPIQPRHHKNAKKSQPYVRTWASTKLLIKDASKEMKPREVIYKTVADDLGGVSKCVSLGQLPRNRQQVKDFVRHIPASQGLEKKNLSGRSSDDDPWYRLLGESKKQAASRKTAFIRDVRVAPEPLCVMTTDRQINDMKRFCCSPIEFRPFTVDPTFDIGHYNVTPITYQHLLLENKRDGKHPSLIGPVLLHEKKTKETYSTFSGTLRTLEPELRDVLAFGTDDEEALLQGFKNNFDRSLNLLCELHLRKTIEKKLQEIGIMGMSKADIVADIFGKRVGTVQESGLVDANGQESFDTMLVNLKQRWSTWNCNGEEFHKWFMERKRLLFLNSVISPVRQRAGLGCPPERFTTNRSEQTNRIIQEFVHKECKEKKSVDEFSFCVALSKLINIQKQEIEMAIVGTGEFRLREKFRFLEVSPERWCRMNEDQKEKALHKLHMVTLEESVSSTINKVTEIVGNEEHPLLIEMVQAGIDWIPRNILSSIIQKALSLAGKSGALSNQSEDTVVVASATNPRKPHIVNFFGNGKTDCTECPGYSSLSICAHSMAACLKTNRTKQFIRWLACSKRNKGGINYSKAVTYGMPKGRGKKGEKAPRKKGKKAMQPATVVIPRVTTASSLAYPQSCIQSGNTPQHCGDALALDSNQQPCFMLGTMPSSNFNVTACQSQNNELFHLQPSQSIARPTQFLAQTSNQRQGPALASERNFPSCSLSANPIFTTPQPLNNGPFHIQSSQSVVSFPHPTQVLFPPGHIPWQQLTTTEQLPPCLPTHANRSQMVGFPSPSFGQFLIYLLQFCPSKTSMCFGCGNPLKEGASVRRAPDDLVIVSKMSREFAYQGAARSKLANVYFHCRRECVRRKQPLFEGNWCIVPPDIKPHILQVHQEHLRNNIGI